MKLRGSSSEWLGRSDFQSGEISGDMTTSYCAAQQLVSKTKVS